MKRRTAAFITDFGFVLFVLLLMFALLSLLGQCGCATDAMCRAYEQIHYDIVAGEYQDADKVALACTQKYGKSKKYTDATTTDDTIRDVQMDTTISGYAGGLLSGWTGYGAGGGLLTLLVTAAAMFLRERKKRIVAENGNGEKKGA